MISLWREFQLLELLAVAFAAATGNVFARSSYGCELGWLYERGGPDPGPGPGPPAFRLQLKLEFCIWACPVRYGGRSPVRTVNDGDRSNPCAGFDVGFELTGC
jgi:hypothetical protein